MLLCIMHLLLETKILALAIDGMGDGLNYSKLI